MTGSTGIGDAFSSKDVTTVMFILIKISARMLIVIIFTIGTYNVLLP